jgi:uncharacterized protein (TIGR03435 family)
MQKVSGCWIVVCGLAIVAAGLPVRAQTTEPEAKLLHLPEGPAPAFEVATIKPNNDPTPGLSFALSVSNFTAKQATFKQLVMLAYNFRSDDQIIGLSGWMASAHFDIKAKASDADIAAFQKLSYPQRLNEVRWMLQSLLAERFALKVSFKTADLPVYALVVAKGGPKMTEVEISPFPPPGTPAPPGAHRPGIWQSGPNQYQATAWSMNSMPEWLSFFDEIGNRVVVNETGLKGYYDFVLNGVSQRFPASSNLNDVAPQEPAASIFAALPEQLGLKLEPKKAPAEVLVIDYVEQPSQN